jgi:hypothetical protein
VSFVSKDLPEVPASQPERGWGLRAVVAILTLALVVVAVGASLWWFTRSDPSGNDTTAAPPTTAQKTPSDITTTSPDLSTSDPTPAPTPTMTSQAALALTVDDARSVLMQWQSRDAARVAGLAGFWVPQVSSKCTGIAVDLRPDFIPDGRIDEFSVTVQQILALQTALVDRYDAVLTTGNDLGIEQRPGTICGSQMIWIALVPDTFYSPDGAHAWCQAAGYPKDECAARFVVPPGQDGTRLDLRE